MKLTISIDIPAAAEPLVRQLLALYEELNALALTSPHGHVLDDCESALLQHGRDLHKNILAQAVARRIETAEKKGPRSAPVPVAGSRKTAGHKHASSSPASASSG